MHGFNLHTQNMPCRLFTTTLQNMILTLSRLASFVIISQLLHDNCNASETYSLAKQKPCKPCIQLKIVRKCLNVMRKHRIYLATALQALKATKI
jgi:hypothetical protein